MQAISLLGSTGSIGRQTLDVASHLGSFRIVALAAHSNLPVLIEQIRKYRPKLVSVYNSSKAKELRQYSFDYSFEIVEGQEGLQQAALHSEADVVVVATTGIQSLVPTVKAIEAGKKIALANKEILVAAGKWLMSKVKQHRGTLLPIDSEHNSLFQLLENRPIEHVKRLIVTASGGPFRTFSLEALEKVSVEQALQHPTWRMGDKITIDSSTLMNKALEVIEAHHLFGIDPEKIDVVIHPQSIVHGFVEWVDHTHVAQINPPHMTFSIQHTLTYPKRLASLQPPLNLDRPVTLEFFPPDHQRFPALEIGKHALKKGKSYPCFLNAANEVLVGRFLKGEISWQQIMQRLERLMNHHTPSHCESFEEVFEIDQEARKRALIA